MSADGDQRDGTACDRGGPLVSVESAVAVRDLSFAVGGQCVLDRLDLDVASGETLAVVGPSGSGKTTLLHCIAGIEKAAKGSVHIGSTSMLDLGQRKRALLRLQRIGLVFQFAELLPELTALENVALPLRLLGADRASAEEAAESWLSRLGLGDRLNQWPGTLSGGQAQRVGLARALVTGPDVVLADEPTGALDEEATRDLVELLSEQSSTGGVAILVATHDPIVAASADRIAELRFGRLVVH